MTLSKKDLGLGNEDGIATLLALIALSIFSLLGLYMILNSTTELKVSDNYESQIQARYAAQAGLSHAREVLRSLRFNDCLKGPDDSHSGSSSYLAQARTAGFRNFINWQTARAIDILNPAGDVASLPDDGLVNTGKFGTTQGTLLIPSTGIALMAPNPYAGGTMATARYFVKVTDNNGETTELLGDPLDDPFVDGDGIVLVRSVGVAQTIRENGSGIGRRNSVAVFEARLKRRKTFELDAPMVIQGDSVSSSFNGTAFEILGGADNYGIATIDTNTSDETFLSAQVLAGLGGKGRVSGRGLNPSVLDITGAITAHEDKALLLDKQYLYDFVKITAPAFADTIYNSNQNWSGGDALDIGSYDPGLSANHPSQKPKVVIVNGDLSVSGNISGGGILIVRGTFSAYGGFSYNGIILVIGEGAVNFGDLSRGVVGAVYAVKVTNTGGVLSFGNSSVGLSGKSRIVIDGETIRMSQRLLPPAQIGFREITSAIDP